MPRKPHTITVPMYDGDDWERLNDLRRRVSIAEAKARTETAGSVRRVGDDLIEPDDHPDVIEARAAYEAFVDEAADRAEMWVLAPIGHGEYRELLKAHPPRTEKDDEGKESVHAEDAQHGFNTETFPTALLSFVDEDDDEIRTILEPEFATAAERKRALKRLSSGEFDTLWIRADGLNQKVAIDPKDLVTWSTSTPASDET